MREYKGLQIYNGEVHDKPEYGGGFVQEHGWGGEMYNFKPYNGKCYGYIAANSGTINLKRIDPNAKDEEKISGVTVVWCARTKEGVKIVGWYKNATVYYNPKYIPKERRKDFKRDIKIVDKKWIKGNRYYGGYLVVADEKDCVLLPELERTFPVRYGRKSPMGKTNVWYAREENEKDSNLRRELTKYKRRLLGYIKNYKPKKASENSSERAKSGGIHRQYDAAKRVSIENEAMERAKKHFENLGYKVTDVSKEDKGWDFEVLKDGEELYVEVKGLSGENVNIELTPNEYEKMQNNKDKYRIFVLTNADKKKGDYYIFSYEINGKLIDEKKKVELTIEERTGARCRENP